MGRGEVPLIWGVRSRIDKKICAVELSVAVLAGFHVPLLSYACLEITTLIIYSTS